MYTILYQHKKLIILLSLTTLSIFVYNYAPQSTIQGLKDFSYDLHKSMFNKRYDELQPSDTNRTKPDAQVLLYNRIPKTSSTFTTVLFRALSKRNQFKNVDWRNSPKLPSGWNNWSEENKTKLVDFLKKHDGRPMAFGNSMFLLNWTTYEPELKVNLMTIIREPISRMVSAFHYVRDKEWRHRKLPKTWFNRTFEQCVLEGDNECKIGGCRVPFKNKDGTCKNAHGRITPQLTYLCGHTQECFDGDNEVALRRAKHNVETQYSVVAILDELTTSMEVLKAYLPVWFDGAPELAATRGKSNANSHSDPEGETQAVNVMKERLWADIDLYWFAKQKLALQKKRIESKLMET